jgi:hypothetical protein
MKHRPTSRRRRSVCIVDLNEVTFIDKNGERLLPLLARDGTQFTSTGIYTTHVLDQLRAKPRRNASAPKSWQEKASRQSSGSPWSLINTAERVISKGRPTRRTNVRRK